MSTGSSFGLTFLPGVEPSFEIVKVLSYGLKHKNAKRHFSSRRNTDAIINYHRSRRKPMQLNPFLALVNYVSLFHLLFSVCPCSLVLES